MENGGVLYRPETREEKPLCPPPNERFVNLLRERNIPFSVFDGKLSRHSISLGDRIPESPVSTNGHEEAKQLLVSPRGASVCIAGPSASGKSTAVAGILEELVQHGNQFCLIDPEGDYDGFTDALSFGSAKEPPDTKAIFPRPGVSPNRA